MSYIARTSKTSPTDMWQNPYWYSNDNLYYDPVYMLPDCTCYTYGRLLELGATNINLCNGGTDNAGNWYNYNDGYERGQTPRLGAVACWYSPSSQGGGHVAIVEAINGTEIVTSNSNLILPSVCGNKDIKSNVWDLWDYWYERTLTPPYGFLDYVLQGFIYVPITGGLPPEPASWITDGTYNAWLSDSDRDSNAIKFYYVMTRLGVTYNAILGMLANINHESKINPDQWQWYYQPDDMSAGYGLVQWTPASKYANWAGVVWRANGQKECERIIYEANNGLQWDSNWYAPYVNYPEVPPITLAEFLADSTTDPKVLADYWLLYYEHPDESGISARIADHQYWVDYFDELLVGGYVPPVPPVPPTPGTRTHGGIICKTNKRKFMKRRGLPWR